jgi:hypothetical protein
MAVHAAASVVRSYTIQAVNIADIAGVSPDANAELSKSYSE